MDLYADYGRSWPQKGVVVALELLLLALSAMILFTPIGAQLALSLGWPVPDGVPGRRVVIFLFSLVVLVRMSVMMVVFMRRAMPWSEAFSVPFAFALYYVGFAILVLPSDAPLGVADWLGIALFFVGSALNTGGEWQRYRFKQKPASKGKLFTGGFFALSMHINFFGDILWVAGYALVTQNLWSILIVVFITAFFALYNVPMLDRHLQEHYGQQFEDYRRKTRRLVPFVW